MGIIKTKVERRTQRGRTRGLTIGSVPYGERLSDEREAGRSENANAAAHSTEGSDTEA